VRGWAFGVHPDMCRSDDVRTRQEEGPFEQFASTSCSALPVKKVSVPTF
jgi:hypothetical protein